MALRPEDIQRLVPELTEWLSAKASESLDERPEEGGLPRENFCDACDSNPCKCGAKTGGEYGDKPEGMGVVIAMKPKGGMGGKVDGCPDCADGTEHKHV